MGLLISEERSLFVVDMSRKARREQRKKNIFVITRVVQVLELRAYEVVFPFYNTLEMTHDVGGETVIQQYQCVLSMRPMKHSIGGASVIFDAL